MKNWSKTRQHSHSHTQTQTHTHAHTTITITIINTTVSMDKVFGKFSLFSAGAF